MEAQDTGKGALQPPPGKAASKHRAPPPTLHGRRKPGYSPRS